MWTYLVEIAKMNDLTINLANLIKAIKQARSDGELKCVHFCSEPNDYLWVVLVKSETEWIAWTYNVQSKGLSHGHYGTFDKAKRMFDRKVWTFEDINHNSLADINQAGNNNASDS